MDTSIATSPAETPIERIHDWEAIERDYRAGLYSLREMGSLHGLTHGAINKRAKRDGWTRDLSAKMQSKAEELVSKALVSSEVSKERLVSERQTVDAGALAIANVRLTHRQDITQTKGLFYTLLREVQDATDNQGLADALMELVEGDSSDPGEDAMASKAEQSRMIKIRQTFDRIMSSPSRIGAAKQLTEMLEKLVKLEREAYGINQEPPQAVQNPLAALLASMRQSTLPIVHEVEPDDTL